jgi:hypothetical protein
MSDESVRRFFALHLAGRMFIIRLLVFNRDPSKQTHP